ncbi:hypothetical protein ACWGDX_02330 [Streptomyces sp. NPDC055025]
MPASGERVGEPVIGAAVMTHPRRRAAATALVARLGRWGAVVAEDPRPDGPPTTLRAARAAWAAVRPGTTHHLVLQDDVELCHGFTDRLLDAVRRHPESPLALYSNWNSWNGAAVRAAALAGAGWVPAVAGEWVPTLGLVLPRRDVDELLAAVDGDTDDPEPDDVVLARELAARGRQVLVSVPHLVEHTGRSSLIGNDAYGPRHATCFADDIGDAAVDVHASGGVLPAPPVLVHILRGRAHVVLSGAGTRPGRPVYLPRRAYEEETGLARRAAAHWRAEQADPRPRPVPAAPAEAAQVERLREELWHAAYLLAVHTARAGDPPPYRAVQTCLRSLVLGGTSDMGPLRLWAEQAAVHLIDLAGRGLAAGELDRARYGPPPGLSAHRLAALPPAERIWQATDEAVGV